MVTTGIRHPTGLAVDYAMDHVLYWVDSKLNTIERMKHDGSNRILVLQGGL
jgi:low density lipoprotein-related protein 2